MNLFALNLKALSNGISLPCRGYQKEVPKKKTDVAKRENGFIFLLTFLRKWLNWNPMLDIRSVILSIPFLHISTTYPASYRNQDASQIKEEL
jgi:hypothetical protein